MAKRFSIIDLIADLIVYAMIIVANIYSKLRGQIVIDRLDIDGVDYFNISMHRAFSSKLSTGWVSKSSVVEIKESLDLPNTKLAIISSQGIIQIPRWAKSGLNNKLEGILCD